MSRLNHQRRNRRRSAVPGQFLGYALQELRVASHLFAAASDDDVVSLEVVGDTAIHHPDGSVRTEEHKSRTSSSNPVADDAVDLWKTLRNWVEATARGDIDASRATYRLYISRPFSGEIVSRLSEAMTRSECEAALDFAAARVWRRPNGEDLVIGLPDRTREHVAAVFAAERAIVLDVIARFQLEYGSGDAWGDLRRVASVAAVEPDLLDTFLNEMVGWVKHAITVRLQRGQLAAIRAADFRVHLRAVRRRLDSAVVLVSAAPGPDAVAIQRHLRSVQTYIRQLELIDATEDDKLEAANDYLRASAARVEWAERGLVHVQSFDDFQDELAAAWRRKKRASDVAPRGHTPAERGMLLYLACCDHVAKLNGMEPPPAFCRGSFHALADHVRIGWHPEYTRLLRETRQSQRSERAPSNDEDAR